MDEGGVDALCERIRRKPNLANRVDQATEDAVIKFATDFPAYGQARTSNELRKCGIFVSACGVRSIWLRHDLANFKTRLKALEVIVAEKGGILTEAQVQALEKKKHDDNEIPVLVGNFVGGFLLTGLPLMYLHTTSQQTKVAI